MDGKGGKRDRNLISHGDSTVCIPFTGMKEKREIPFAGEDHHYRGRGDARTGTRRFVGNLLFATASSSNPAIDRTERFPDGASDCVVVIKL